MFHVLQKCMSVTTVADTRHMLLAHHLLHAVWHERPELVESCDVWAGHHTSNTSQPSYLPASPQIISTEVDTSLDDATHAMDVVLPVKSELQSRALPRQQGTGAGHAVNRCGCDCELSAHLGADQLHAASSPISCLNQHNNNP